MARDKEEELLDLPEFDEKEFIRSEKNRAKAVVTFFLIGAGMGLLAGYLYDIHLWYFAVLLLFVFIVFIRFIMQALKLEVPKTNGQKFFLFMEYFLAFIIFWVLFLNPPFSVVSGPQISNIQVQGTGGTWESASALTNNFYSYTPGNNSYRAYIYFVYPIESIQVNELLYASLTSTSTLRQDQNISYHYVGNEIYFNITSGFQPVQGRYLVFQILTYAHGQQHTFTLKLTLPSLSLSGSYYYKAQALPLTRAGVV